MPKFAFEHGAMLRMQGGDRCRQFLGSIGKPAAKRSQGGFILAKFTFVRRPLRRQKFLAAVLRGVDQNRPDRQVENCEADRNPFDEVGMLRQELHQQRGGGDRGQESGPGHTRKSLECPPSQVFSCGRLRAGEKR